jgi:hypothetical protein
MNNTVIFLLCLLVILQVLDVVSTAKALKNPKLAEGNPVVSFFIKKLGVTGGLVAIKLLAAGAVTWALITYPFGSSADLVVLVVLNVVYVYIVVNNFRLLRS